MPFLPVPITPAIVGTLYPGWQGSNIVVDGIVRFYAYQFPKNFNGTAVLCMQTGDGTAITNLDVVNFSGMINALLAVGCAIIFPFSRPTFSQGCFGGRYESENNNNSDIDFIRYITGNEFANYNANTTGRPINKIIVMGGSSGGIFSTRFMYDVNVNGVAVFNGGHANQIKLIQSPCTVIYDDNFSLSPNSCPLLIITSSIDATINPLKQKLFISKARAAGIAVTSYIDPAGEHAFSAWFDKYWMSVVSWVQIV